MYINLQLALSICTSSFCLDLRKSSDFLCSLEVENANLELWRTGIYVFFAWCFHGKIRFHGFFASKLQKVARTAKSGAITSSCGGKPLKRAEIRSNEHLFVFFRGCRYISLFKIGQSSTFAKLSRRCLSIWFSPSFRPAFASWVLAFAGTTQFKPK